MLLGILVVVIVNLNNTDSTDTPTIYQLQTILTECKLSSESEGCFQLLPWSAHQTATGDNCELQTEPCSIFCELARWRV